MDSLYIYNLIYVLRFDCAGSSWLCAGLFLVAVRTLLVGVSSLIEEHGP